MRATFENTRSGDTLILLQRKYRVTSKGQNIVVGDFPAGGNARVYEPQEFNAMGFIREE